ncbi:MAG: peptidylprolyl isomerase [Lachnospiraceae bacterium]|nr:peptidylprolyl isomerase [Lachnospiraceae bacterium]
MIRITMENGGVIDLELDYSAAPKTVKNFEKLVGQGFYDGLIFHRVIKGFMIQGGDPLGNGMGGSKEKIKGEFSSNGWNNPISHKRGVISMARAMDPNSASSQFFIMHKDGEFLDGQYAAFGHVVSGMDVVDQIASCRTGFMDRPKTPQKIKTIRIVEA